MTSKKKQAPYLTQLAADHDWEAGDAFLASLGKPAAEQAAGRAPATLRDAAVSLGQGVVSGTKMLTDVAGADNAVSRALGSANEGLQGMYTPARKAEMERRAQAIADADASGDKSAQIAARMGGFGEAPMQTLLQGAGSIVPTLPAMLIPGGQAVGAANIARAVGMAGVGAAQGVGSVKGSIYDEVKQALLQRGVPEGEAEQQAQAAQSYTGPNAAQIALGGGIGAVAGRVGAEGAIERLVHGAGVKKAIVPRVAGGVGAEGASEAVQGGQQQYATNSALNQAGIETDPWRGVAGAAALEGTVGAIIGGGLNAVPPGDAIRAHKLPESGPLTKAANASLEAQAQAADAGVAPAAPISGAAPAASALEPAAGRAAPDAAGPASPEAEPPIFSAEVLDVKSALAQPGAMDAVRARFGDEGAKQLLDSLAQAQNPKATESVRKKHLQAVQEGLARLNDEPLAPPEPAALGVEQPAALPAPDAPLQIPLDTTPTGVMRVDGDGNASAEINAEAIQSRAAAENAASLGTGVPWGAGSTQEPAAAAPPQIGYDTAPTGTLVADAAGNVAAETNADRINRRQEVRARRAEARRKADMGLTPDVEAAQARMVRPSDIVNPAGAPFKSKFAADRAARAAPDHQVVEVDGGWALRKPEPAEKAATVAGNPDSAGAVPAQGSTPDVEVAQAAAVPEASVQAAEPQAAAAAGAGPTEAPAGATERAPANGAAGAQARLVSDWWAGASPADREAAVVRAGYARDGKITGIGKRIASRPWEDVAPTVRARIKAPEATAGELAQPAQQALQSKQAADSRPDEVWNGVHGKGMLPHAGRMQLAQKRKQRPDLEWTIVPAPEFGEDRIKLEGRKPAAVEKKAPAGQPGEQVQPGSDRPNAGARPVDVGDGSLPGGESGAAPAFTRVGPRPGAVERSGDVDALAKRIAARWTNAPEVVTVESLSDPAVPEAVRAHDQAQRSQGATGEPEGFFYGGKVYLVAGQLKGDADVVRVLFHEALGHYGLRGTFGDKLGAMLDRMAALNVAKVKAKAAEYGLDYSKPADRRVAAEEVLAEMAQRSPELGWVKQAVAAIRNWLRVNVPGLRSLKLTDADIVQQFILPARRFVQQGKGAAEGQAAFSRGAAAALDGGADAAATTEAVANGRAGWRLPESTRLDGIVYELQDKLLDTRAAVQAIRKAVGQIRDEFNPYLQEELYHGRAAKQTADFLDKEVKPLMAEIARSGVDMKAFEKYLHARHAEERNAQIAKINADMPDGGSGMKTADAQAYLQGLSAAERAKLDGLAAKVDAITAGTRQHLVDTGLEAADVVKAWEGAYEHYVPLQRADVDADGSMRGTGAGFSVKGSASKRAMGSDREVDNILANVVMQRERAITRAEKNRVATALYGLAIKAPNKGFWQAIDPDANGRTPAELRALEAELVDLGLDAVDAEAVFKEPKQRFVDAKTGLVGERINPAIRSRDNVLALRVNGKDRFVFFSDRDPRAVRMVTALKNLDAPQMGELMSLSAKVTRYFAAINTAYNPIFGIINLARDFQSALFNTSTTAIAGHEKDVARNVPAALKGVMQALRARRAGEAPTGTWATLFDEFEKAGGRTGYRDMYATANDRAQALENEIKKVEQGKGMEVLHAMGGMLTDYNDTMENALRLSAYKVARDRGLSADQAASLAKNLTVNFNRKGHLTQQIGALYAFFNASAQGTARLVETMRGPAGKKIFVGGLLLGAVQALLMEAADFEDGQPPDFVRERSFIIPTGGGKYIAIPMPLGLHVLPSLTRVPMEWALGGYKDTPKKLTSLLGLFVDTFNPIGGAGMSLQTLTPTIIDPLAALAENKDFSGRAIAKEDFPGQDTPGFTRKRDNASLWGKGMSYAFNWLSGGTDFKPGVFSPTPDQIDYLIGQATGGVGRELAKVSQTVEAGWKGEDLPVHKVPLFGRLYGDTTEDSAVSSAFYENLKQLSLHKQELRGRRAQGEPVADYLEENPEAKLVVRSSAYALKVSNLRKRRRALVEADAPQEKVSEIDQRITAEMRRFNEMVKAVKQD